MIKVETKHSIKNINNQFVFSSGEESPKLLTLEKLFNVPSKPVITSFYNDIVQEIGTTLIMPCRVKSYSEHQIFWQDNNGGLVYGNPRTRVRYRIKNDLYTVDLSPQIYCFS